MLRIFVILLLFLITDSALGRIPFAMFKTSASSDVCLSSVPSIGTSCDSGAIFAGVFDGGKYMVTPGGCTDSATPTCAGGTDSVSKVWRGTSGSGVNIAGVENGDEDLSSSPAYRGDVNTAAIVADASISSDSAADYCNDMTYAGYSDWYLPSKSELAHILCKSNASIDATHPQESPNCTQLGGKTSDISGIAGACYWSSTEHSGGGEALNQCTWFGTQYGDNKSSSNRIRCIRRYGEGNVDKVDDGGLVYSDFVGSSTIETISSFDETIYIEVTAVNTAGTPTPYYNLNSSGWTTMIAGTSVLIPTRAGDTLQFRVTGALSQATFTIKNATNSFTTIDTVLGVVPP